MPPAKPAPENPWKPIGLLILIIAGSLIYLYVRGGLSELTAKSLLLPPPPETQTAPTSDTSASGNTYANHELQNTYPMDPNPIQTNPPQQ